VTDPNPGNNSATDSDTLTPEADLAITKTNGVTSVVPGTPTTYTIVVSNAGPSAVTGASVSDPLSAGATFAGWVATARSGGGRVSGPSSGSGALATTVDLPVGATVTFAFTVLVSPSATGTLTNTARVDPPAGATDPNPGNNSATDSDTLTPQADLAITKTDNTLSVVPGTSTTYTIVVRNHGPSAVTGASVSDPLPAGVTAATWVATASSGGGSVSGPASGSGALATTVNLPAGATVTFTFTAQIDPAATGFLINTATVTPPAGVTDPNPGNNSDSDTDTLTPQADLAITKVVSDPRPKVGDTVTFTVTLANNGPSLATDVQVSDPLPPGLTFVSATPSQGAYSGGTGLWTVGTVASGAQAVLQLQAHVVSPNAETNTATITHSDQPDPNPNNNSGSASVTPQQADLAVTKTVSNARPNVGDLITFTVTLTNHGPDAAGGVGVSDPLPVGLAFVSATMSQGWYDSSSGLWTVGSVANGASVVLTLSARVTDPGARSNTAAVASSDQFDPNPSNNQATAGVVPQQADLELTKAVDNPQPTAGGTVTFTLVIHNNGPDAATGVLVGDPFPAGLTFAGAGVPSQGAFDPASGVWAVGTLAPGASASLQLVALVTAPGPIINQAFASADQFDPDLADNMAATGLTALQSAATIGKRDTLTTTMGLLAAGDPSAPPLTVAEIGFVDQVYRDLLHREADPMGLAYWGGLIAQGATPAQVVLAIEGSAEYRGDVVDELFRQLLDRPADPLAQSFFGGLLAGGGTPEQVEAIILGSPEYFARRGGGTIDGFLIALYHDTLNRDVDPLGQATWGGMLAGGATRAQVADEVLGSTEFQRDLVQSDYRTFLRRAADPAGLNVWLSDLQHGARDNEVLAALLGSDEYLARV
jgi:uncharacterized repeat protein (TIGR01451 family)